MKTVITSTKNDINALLDKRFGRAAWFCVLDEETGETNFIENIYVNVNGGAGTKSAEKMVEMGVEKIISGDFGPKAKDLLNKFKIQMVVIQDDNNTIQDIIKMMSS